MDSNLERDVSAPFSFSIPSEDDRKNPKAHVRTRAFGHSRRWKWSDEIHLPTAGRGGRAGYGAARLSAPIGRDTASKLRRASSSEHRRTPTVRVVPRASPAFTTTSTSGQLSQEPPPPPPPPPPLLAASVADPVPRVPRSLPATSTRSRPRSYLDGTVQHDYDTPDASGAPASGITDGTPVSS